MIKMKLRPFYVLPLLALTVFLSSPVFAQEVDKGKIPADQLEKSLTTIAFF